jgi:hypothetical protein
MKSILLAVVLFPISLAGETFVPKYRIVARFPESQGYPSVETPLVESRSGGIYGIFDEADPPSRLQAGGIFRLQNGECRVLHRFVGSGGYLPVSLFEGDDGSLYGQCISGGEFQGGTLWRFDTANGVYHKIADLVPDPYSPQATGITPDGRFYGIKYEDELFIRNHEGEIRSFFKFATLPAVPAGQVRPSRPIRITLGSDGAYYGTTFEGGPLAVPPYNGSRGVFFRVTTSGEFQKLAEFNELTGNAPYTIVEGSDGAFYGLSRRNGTLPVLLRMSATGSLELIHEFSEAEGYGHDGLHVFVGPDHRVYAEVSRVSTESAATDLLLRYDTGTRTSEVIRYTGNQRGKSVFLTTRGDLFSSFVNRTYGIVSVMRGLGLGPFNRQPFARRDKFDVPSGSLPITLNPLRNDGDRDGDKLTITGVSTPAHGTAEIADGGRRIVYTPAVDGIVSDSFTYTVSDGHEWSEATSTVSLAAAGPGRTYAGMFNFFGAPAYFRATVSRSGQVTGFVIPNGTKLTFRAALDDARSYTKTVPMELLIPEGEVLVGDLKVTVTEIPGTGNAAPQLKSDLEFNGAVTSAVFSPAPRVVDVDSRYALTMPPIDPLEDSSRQPGDEVVNVLTPPGARPKNLGGAGWTTLTVNARGHARLVGKLADGRSISFGGPLSDQLKLPIFARCSPLMPVEPMPPRGFFAGNLSFSEANASETEPACSGMFRWTRPWVYTPTSTTLFRKGFAILQPVTGYRYTEPASPLAIPDETGRALMTIQLDGIPNLSPASSLVIVEDTTFRSPELNALFALDEVGGSLFGFLRHPQLSAPSQASGVLIPQLKQVIGLYRTPFGTAQFRIRPR